MFSVWTVGGTILLLAGMSGNALAVPISATTHHATTVQTTSATSSGIVSLTDLFGPGTSSSAADREGTADFSANNLPQMHHLIQPPKTSSSGSVDASPSVAGVPDGGTTAMMLSAVVGGTVLLARRTIHVKRA